MLRDDEVDVAADADDYNGEQHGWIQQHILALVNKGRVILRSRMALSRTRVSAISRTGSSAMARVTLRSRAKGEGNLEVMGEDECIGKAEG